MLLTGELLFEMNIVNPKDLKASLRHYQDQAETTIGKTWIKKQAYNYMKDAPEDERESLGFRLYDPEIDEAAALLPDGKQPEWLTRALAAGDDVYVFTNEANEDLFQEILSWLNSGTPDAQSVGNSSWAVVRAKAAAYDPSAAARKLRLNDKKDRLKAAQQAGDAEAEGILKEVGVNPIYRFDDGYFWTDLVPTTAELAGDDDRTSDTLADTFKGDYKALRDESFNMGKGAHHAIHGQPGWNEPHFCVGSGRYGLDGLLRDKTGHIFSLRDPSGHPHVTMEVRGYEKGKINQIFGTNNLPVTPRYMPYVREFVQAFGIDPGKSGKAMGLLADAKTGKVSSIEDLPDGFTSAGGLDFKGMDKDSFRLPKNLTIQDGDLDLTDTGVDRLPAGLTVAKVLRIKGTQITHFPKDTMSMQVSCDTDKISNEGIREYSFRIALDRMMGMFTIDVERVYAAINELLESGEITPERVVEHAANTNSPFHELLISDDESIGWEDDSAEAHAYRLAEVPNMLASHYVGGGSPTEADIARLWKIMLPKVKKIYMEDPFQGEDILRLIDSA